MTEANQRTSSYPIDPLFLDRWSPRAFTGEAIDEHELLTLFEAARWAPSSFNSQPWRFLYARRDTPRWPTFLGLLNEFNQSWANRAAAIVVLVSSPTFRRPQTNEDVPSRSHSFDAGAAWNQLALQAIRSGWHAHAAVGGDLERAASSLNVPSHYRVEAFIIIGRKGDASVLSDALQKREIPSERLPLGELAFEGGFVAR